MDPEILFRDQEVCVTATRRGPSVYVRFDGPGNPALLDWISKGLGEMHEPVALLLGRLTSFGAALGPVLLRLGKRKAPIVLVAPPIDLLDSVGDRLPTLSSEAALLESGSLPDSLAKEREALAEFAGRISNNPLWRRVDQEEAWLCPFCGAALEGAKLPHAAKPTPTTLLLVRRHLLDACAAWRAGRRTPLPAMVLDAFLADINKRKTAAETERKRLLSERVETLQVRVESVKELERSVNEAQRRQLHLLPIGPKPDPVAEIAVAYRPLQSVSGDFLDFYSLPGDRFGVAIGDVSGHGVEAAIIMGMAKMALRVRSENPSLRDWILSANRDLYRELRRVAFVTGCVVLIDRPTRRMSYVRAGHTKSLLRRSSGECEALDADGLPLGVDEGTRFEKALELREASLAPGDLLLLYTDGVIEAGAEGPGEFGMDRLRETFRAAPAAASAEAALRLIESRLDSFLGGAPLSDDVTLICLKIC